MNETQKLEQGIRDLTETLAHAGGAIDYHKSRIATWRENVANIQAKIAQKNARLDELMKQVKQGVGVG